MERGMRDRLGGALRELGEAAGGAGAVQAVAFAVVGGRPTFYMVVSGDRADQLIGHGGNNAGYLRMLLRVRAGIEGWAGDPINMRVVRADVPVETMAVVTCSEVPRGAAWVA